MRALLYLTLRTVINSFRRALQSPTRLIGAVMIIAWWFMVVVGNLFESPRNRGLPPGMPQLELPGSEVVFSILFAIFGLVLIFRLLGMFRPPGTYRPADSDVLFATPISPRTVMLHRFVIDYLMTLLIPILILLFGGRRSAEGIEFLFRNLPDPENASLVTKTIIGAFLLVSLFGVAFGYATGMYVNRDSKVALIVRRIAIMLFISLGVGLATLIALAFDSGQPGRYLMEAAVSLPMRVVAYPAAAAADLAMMPIYANWAAGLAGGAFLLLGSIALLGIALKQSHHLYDMAARHTAANITKQEVQRSGDMSLAFIYMAREGKLKVRKYGFISRLRLTGPWAILWRESLLILRTQLAASILFLVLACGLPLLVLMDKSGKFLAVALPLQAVIVGSFAMGFGQSGFLEALRRVDVEKPLPFTPFTICALEIVAHSVVPIVIAWLSMIAIFIASPVAYDIALAGFFGLPGVVIVIVGVQFCVLLLFPDMDDPTQRSFRVLVQMLGSLLALLPALIVAIPLSLLTVWIPLVAALSLVINLLVAYVLTRLTEELYSRYNPSE